MPAIPLHIATAGVFFRLFSGERPRRIRQRAIAAGWRHDAVVAQIINHQAKVIDGIDSGEDSDGRAGVEERRGRIAKGRECVLVGDGGDGLVALRE